MDSRFGFDEPKGARENGIVVNNTENGYEVIMTGEKAVNCTEKFFDTAEEAYYYVVDKLRGRKKLMDRFQDDSEYDR